MIVGTYSLKVFWIQNPMLFERAGSSPATGTTCYSPKLSKK